MVLFPERLIFFHSQRFAMPIRAAWYRSVIGVMLRRRKCKLSETVGCLKSGARWQRSVCTANTLQTISSSNSRWAMAGRIDTGYRVLII